MEISKKTTNTRFHLAPVEYTPANVDAAKAILCDQTGCDEASTVSPLEEVWGVINKEGSLFFRTN